MVTFAEDAFDKTTGSYPNEAVPIFEQIGAEARTGYDGSATGAPGDQDPPLRRLKRPWRAADRVAARSW